jgi:protein gp37
VDLGSFLAVESRPDARKWITVGGEKGAEAREFDLAWARSIIEQCERAAVPCFVKQLGARPVYEGSTGELYPIRLESKKGGDVGEWPSDLRVRTFPR